MSNRTHFLSFVFILTFLCAYYTAAQSVTVYIPTDLTTSPDASGVEVPVNVTDVTDFGIISVDLAVSYDTNVLTAIGVTMTGTIAQGSMAPYNIDDANGTIDIAIIRTTPFSGSGTLIYIIFDVDSEVLNDSSLLNLTQVKLNSGRISAETSNGKITLVDTPVEPEPLVTVSVPKLVVPPTTTEVQIPVNVSDVTGLGIISANLTISYDINVLAATSATLTGTIAEGGTVLTNPEDASGTIKIGLIFSTPEKPALSGSGVLVYINFDVISNDPKDSSLFSILEVCLNDGKIATAMSSGEISLPVTLSSFFVVTDISRDKVILKWQTEGEVNNLGFAIYRSEQKNGPYTKIGWVESEGDTHVPCKYQFIDETTEKGKVYFYMLEQIDITGKGERSNTIRFDWSKKYQLITTWGKLKN